MSRYEIGTHDHGTLHIVPYEPTPRHLHLRDRIWYWLELALLFGIVVVFWAGVLIAAIRVMQ